METINLDNIHIVLVQPRYPENIGSAARAMRNMGLRHLSVVAPENFDRSRAFKLATHAAADVIERCRTFDDLKEALASCQYVVGTTARLGKHRQVIQTPERLACQLIPISQENRVAILFGPEDKGLSNADTRLCHALVNIPTADFSSLNLAQAVICPTAFDDIRRSMGSQFKSPGKIEIFRGHHRKIAQTHISHGPGCRPDILGIAGLHEYDMDVIEIDRFHQV